MSWLWAEPRRRRKTKKQKGRTAYRKGKVGETKVERLLSRRGFTPMIARFRTKGGEIDRIMRDPHNRKVAVEVKNLSSPIQGAAMENLPRKSNSRRSMEQSAE